MRTTFSKYYPLRISPMRSTHLYIVTIIFFMNDYRQTLPVVMKDHKQNLSKYSHITY